MKTPLTYTYLVGLGVVVGIDVVVEGAGHDSVVEAGAVEVVAAVGVRRLSLQIDLCRWMDL